LINLQKFHHDILSRSGIYPVSFEMLLLSFFGKLINRS